MPTVNEVENFWSRFPNEMQARMFSSYEQFRIDINDYYVNFLGGNPLPEASLQALWQARPATAGGNAGTFESPYPSILEGSWATSISDLFNGVKTYVLVLAAIAVIVALVIYLPRGK